MTTRSVNFKDLTGQRFGRLIVIEEVPKEERPKSGVYWKCQCDCGNTAIIRAADLQQGRVNSCKCLRNTLSKLTPEQRLQHRRVQRNKFMKTFRNKQRELNPLPPIEVRCSPEELARRRQQYLADQRKWRSNSTNAFLKRIARHGLSVDRYNQQLEMQGGVCAICGGMPRPKRSFSIDHDHKCCKDRFACNKCFRGILCERCNMVIGAMNDNPILLLASAAYLQRQSPRTLAVDI